MCKISVIVPAYNVENYIDKSFKSLLAQTFQDFEIIAITLILHILLPTFK